LNKYLPAYLLLQLVTFASHQLLLAFLFQVIRVPGYVVTRKDAIPWGWKTVPHDPCISVVIQLFGPSGSAAYQLFVVQIRVLDADSGGTQNHSAGSNMYPFTRF
jgi:hypothetical protein